MSSQTYALDVLWQVMSRHDSSCRVMSARALSSRSSEPANSLPVYKTALAWRFPDISAETWPRGAMFFCVPEILGKQG